MDVTHPRTVGTRRGGDETEEVRHFDVNQLPALMLSGSSST